MKKRGIGRPNKNGSAFLQRLNADVRKSVRAVVSALEAGTQDHKRRLYARQRTRPHFLAFSKAVKRLKLLSAPGRRDKGEVLFAIYVGALATIYAHSQTCKADAANALQTITQSSFLSTFSSLVSAKEWVQEELDELDTADTDVCEFIMQAINGLLLGLWCCTH